MSEPLIVTITISRGDVKVHQQILPAAAEGGCEFGAFRGIDLGDGRVFHGYEFKPDITGEQRGPFVSLPAVPEEPLV